MRHLDIHDTTGEATKGRFVNGAGYQGVAIATGLPARSPSVGRNGFPGGAAPRA